MTIWYLMGLELTINWIYKLQTPSHEWSNDWDRYCVTVSR